VSAGLQIGSFKIVGQTVFGLTVFGLTVIGLKSGLMTDFCGMAIGMILRQLILLNYMGESWQCQGKSWRWNSNVRFCKKF
jgi:hypothetical protein